jgi:hypothetical protein
MTLTAPSPVNIGSSRFVRSGKMPSTRLKIRCPKGRAGSTPALGTSLKLSLLPQLALSLYFHAYALIFARDEGKMRD